MADRTVRLCARSSDHPSAHNETKPTRSLQLPRQCRLRSSHARLFAFRLDAACGPHIELLRARKLQMTRIMLICVALASRWRCRGTACSATLDFCSRQVLLAHATTPLWAAALLGHTMIESISQRTRRSQSRSESERKKSGDIMKSERRSITAAAITPIITMEADKAIEAAA